MQLHPYTFETSILEAMSHSLRVNKFLSDIILIAPSKHAIPSTDLCNFNVVGKNLISLTSYFISSTSLYLLTHFGSSSLYWCLLSSHILTHLSIEHVATTVPISGFAKWTFQIGPSL